MSLKITVLMLAITTSLFFAATPAAAISQIQIVIPAIPPDPDPECAGLPWFVLCAPITDVIVDRDDIDTKKLKSILVKLDLLEDDIKAAVDAFLKIEGIPGEG